MKSNPVMQRPFMVLAFGVLLPVFCFLGDPGFFWEGELNGLLGRFSMLVYLMSAVAMTCLLSWRRYKISPSMACGVLRAGSLLAWSIGLFLVPFSVLGLFELIGVFGFIPLFTAQLYWAEGERAKGLAAEEFSLRRAWLAGGLLIGTFVLAQCCLIAVHNQAIRSITHGSDEERSMAIERLDALGPFFYPKALVIAFKGTELEVERTRLKGAYHKATGSPFPMIRGYRVGRPSSYRVESAVRR